MERRSKIDVFTLVGKLRLEGADEVNAELQKTKANLKSLTDSLKVFGAAFTAVGVAGLKLSSDARKTNAELGSTALTLGITTKEMRDLALATTDVAFPLGSVAATFDILSRAGIRNTEEMRGSALAFDALADATGSSAEMMADQLIPIYRAFGQELPSTADDMDKFTWLTKNTTINLSDFATVVQRLAPEMQAAGISMDDATIALAVLESRGITGRTATMKLSEAIQNAAKNNTKLSTELGLTSTELLGYQTQLANSTGLTQKYADVAEGQFGIMDKVKQKFSELALAAGSFLEPFEPMLGVLAALGPLLLFASSSMAAKAAATIRATISLLAHTVATIATTVASIALTFALGGISVGFRAMGAAIMSIPVFGWILAGISAVIAIGVLLWKNWDKVTGFFKSAWSLIKEYFLKGVLAVLTAVSKITAFIPGLGAKVDEAREKLQSMIDAEQFKREAEKYGVALDGTVEDIERAKQAIKDNAEAIVVLTDKQKALNTSMAESESVLEGLSKKYDRAKTDSAGYGDAVAEATEDIKTHSIELKEAEGELAKIEVGYDAAKKAVSDFENKVAEANRELQGLSDPRLEGMQEFEDQLFSLTQEMNKLRLERAQMLGAGSDADTAAIDAQIDALENSREQIELTRDIKFDPLLRQARESTEEIQGLNEEMAPQSVFDRIAQLGKDLGSDGVLGKGLADAKTNLNTVTTAYTAQGDVVKALQDEIKIYQGELDTLNVKIQDVYATWEVQISQQKILIADIGAQIDDTQARLNALNSSPIPVVPAPTSATEIPGYGQYVTPLQTGGIARRPMHAIIGEHAPRIPEVISPLDDLLGMIRSALRLEGIAPAGGGITSGVIISGNNFYVREEADIDRIAQRMVDKIRLKGVRA